MMLRRKLLSSMIMLNTLAATAVFAQDYDLVINNGRVIDPETLFDDIANVGIKDGRIVCDQPGCNDG